MATKKINITLTEKQRYRLETVLEVWNIDLNDTEAFTVNDVFNTLLAKEFEKIISKGVSV